MGCVLGVLLMRFFEHSLVYYLDSIGIPFVWLGLGMTGLIALACILLASLIGALGAFFRLGEQAAASPTISSGRRADWCSSAPISPRPMRPSGARWKPSGGSTSILPPGEFAAIVGRSGSGKSSLMAMIGGLSRPTRGQVQIGGTDIWSLSDARLAAFRNHRIGFVFQFASLLGSLRVVDNVALPALLGRRMEAAAAYGTAAELLDQLGLADYLDAYPSEISAGEQRRAVIARALINAPALLLADEPTSDLDEQTEIELMDQLCALNRDRGMTLIIVTHNLRLAERAGRALHIADGRLAP